MKKSILWLVVAFFGASTAWGQDFSTALQGAFAQMPIGADQASFPTVAAEDFSSANPAIVAAGQDYKVGAMATYGFVSFKNGPTMQLESVSVSGKLPKDAGALQLTYVHANSKIARINESDSFGIDGIYAFDLQYGKKIGSSMLLTGDELYVGIEYTHAESNLKFASLFDPEIPLSADLSSNSKSDAGTIGVYYKPLSNLRIGALYSKTWDAGKDETRIGGELIDSASARSQTDTLRAGMSYQLLPRLLLAGEFQQIFSKDSNITQYFLGAEYYVIPKAVALYASLMNGGPTAGIGIYSDNFGVNVAYQHKPFQDLEHYLGRSGLFMVSVYGNF